MGVVMKQFIDRFKAMEKIANETLAANPEALVGVESLPGSEHDAKVPEEAKKPDAEVTQGQPSGATSTSGAVAGGDAKPLNEGKLEMDQALTNPEKKPLVTDDALTAKVANEHLTSLVKDLLKDIGTQKAASCASAAKPAEQKKEDGKAEGAKAGTAPAAQKKAEPSNKITLDDETISKIAAAQATFMLGREAAEKIMKQATAKKEAGALSAEAARKLVKAACIKAAQEQGLDTPSIEYFVMQFGTCPLKPGITGCMPSSRMRWSMLRHSVSWRLYHQSGLPFMLTSFAFIVPPQPSRLFMANHAMKPGPAM